MTRRAAVLAVFALALLAGLPLHAACPDGAVEGEIRYNADYHVLVFCNGEHWISTASSGATSLPGGSAGAIQFNSNSTFGGNTKLFWDNSLERLGVGTSSPAQTLDVTGTAAISGAVTMGSTLGVTGNTTFSGNVGIGTESPGALLDVKGSISGVQIPSTGAGIVLTRNGPNYIQAVSGSSAVLVAQASNYLQFDTGTTPSARLFINSTGNVGIGTTTPSSLLHLYSSTSAAGLNVEANGNAEIKITRSNATQPGTAFLQVVNLGRLTVSADDYITLNPGNTEKFRITTGGNVGIGTTNPSQMLSVGASNQFTVTSAGAVTGASFSGSGASLTALNATNLASGTIPDARFPATLPAISGANLTALNASNLASGTVDTSRLGSGTASASTYLRGDGTWATPSGIPSGAVMAFDLASCPSGWTEYTAARGRFLRGIDNGAGNDPGGTRAPGNTQADALGSHNHSVDPPNTSTSTNGDHSHTGAPAGTHTWAANDWSYSYATGNTGNTGSGGSHSHTVDIAAFNSASTGTTETRPKNVAVLFCRKD